MFCKKCGNEIQNGTKFCVKCGEKVPENMAGTQVPPASHVASSAQASDKKKKSFIIPIAIIGGVIVLLGTAFALYKAFTVGPFSNIFASSQVEERDDDDEDEDIKEEKVEKEDIVEEAAPAEEETAAKEAEEEVEASAISKEEWCDAYSSYLREHSEYSSEGDYAGFGLLDINGDDVMELAILGNCEAAGNRFYTYSENGIDELITSRLGYSYLEGGNILINTDGHMGYYYDTAYEIGEDGKWTMIFDGFYSEELGPDGYSDSPSYDYSVNGDSVSKEEYESKLKDFYDPNTFATLDYFTGETYTYGEVVNMLETYKPVLSKVATIRFSDDTEIHKYAIYVEDVSWWTAKEKCNDNGGYLLRINSPGEYDFIVDMIKDKGLEDKIFWIAGTKDYSENTYRWIDNNYRYETTDLVKDSPLNKYWMEGEPSFSSANGTDDLEDEYCMDMFFFKGENRFVWNDVPSDISSYYPGKIAYICEME